MALSGYLWFSKSNLQKTHNTLTGENMELEKLHTELDLEYKTALQDLEDLRGDNQELNELIENQKADLAKQKKRISGLIWTEREMGKAREEIANMQLVANQYVSEINLLKTKNQELTSQNANLTEANTNMSEEIIVNKKKINNLDSVKTILVSQTEELSAVKEVLAEKVDMAEAIKINSIEVKGFDINNKGDYKQKNKASKIDVLRACFRTETNMVVPAGEEEFFVTFVSPGGETLYVEELGSGTMINKLDGQTVRYTASGSVEYQNEDLDACLDWKPNFQLAKGVYKVHMYNNGFNVGNGEFTLK